MCAGSRPTSAAHPHDRSGCDTPAIAGRRSCSHSQFCFALHASHSVCRAWANPGSGCCKRDDVGQPGKWTRCVKAGAADSGGPQALQSDGRIGALPLCDVKTFQLFSVVHLLLAPRAACLLLTSASFLSATQLTSILSMQVQASFNLSCCACLQFSTC